jgi:hypothetical protein
MSKKKAPIHNIYEYQFALQIVKDIDEVLIQLDKFRDILYNYNRYTEVKNIVDQIDESKIVLQLHYASYEEVVKTKGKQNE